MFTGILEKDQHGGRKAAIGEKKQAKILVEEHIKRFPRLESHYCRSISNRQYLHSELTIRKMHQMLIKELQDKAKPSLSLYRQLLNQAICLSMALRRISVDTLHIAKELLTSNAIYRTCKYTVDIQQKQSFRKKIKTERRSSKKSIKNWLCDVCSLNLQLEIYLPISNESALFHKRR